jgi:hypothetical protein
MILVRDEWKVVAHEIGHGFGNTKEKYSHFSLIETDVVFYF